MNRSMTGLLWISMISSSALTLPFFAAYSSYGQTLALFLILVWPLFFVEHSSFMMLTFCLYRFLFFNHERGAEEGWYSGVSID